MACARGARRSARPAAKYFRFLGAGNRRPGRIEVFEPGHHLRVVTERRRPNECYAPGAERAVAQPVLIAVDYYLESRQGKTFLRLVNSGFLTTSDWDGEYDGTKLGWPVYLDLLRFALIHHPRAICRQFFRAVASMPVNQAWARLMALTGCAARSRSTQYPPVRDIAGNSPAAPSKA